ncbi:hypothetical protein GC170_14560 [bacterium]|nr:hypothetical protein [bacterium]
MPRVKDRQAVAAKVLEMVSSGLTIARACEWAGVSLTAFRNWRRDDVSLSVALKKAEIEFEAQHLANITTAAAESWQASAWLLERKFKKRYAKITYAQDPRPKKDEADESPILIRIPTVNEHAKGPAKTETTVAGLKAKRNPKRKPKADA